MVDLMWDMISDSSSFKITKITKCLHSHVEHGVSCYLLPFILDFVFEDFNCNFNCTLTYLYLVKLFNNSVVEWFPGSHVL